MKKFVMRHPVWAVMVTFVCLFMTCMFMETIEDCLMVVSSFVMACFVCTLESEIWPMLKEAREYEDEASEEDESEEDNEDEEE